MTATPDTCAPVRTMRAVRLHARGGPEQIVYEEAPRPVLASGDALVRVHAVGITPGELSWSIWETPDGRSLLPVIPGREVSGVVAAVTPGVTAVAVGDAVFALADFRRPGAAAEYVAVRAADLAPKPRTLDHAHAAAAPLSALTAWQALFDRGGLAAGQRVLIHGAAGSVGAFAVQLARWRGAEVVATARARDAAFLADLGAAETLDDTTARFEERLRDVDLVLDTVGGATQDRSWAVLRPGGALVSTAAPPALSRAAAYGARGAFVVVRPDRGELTELAGLLDAGRLRPLVAAVLPLTEAHVAYERGRREHPRGKIVLRVAA
ncbi:MAG TPA: NADP-dependent oxidoreductase [Thermomicrobiales bacterium]|nr:NADP-dependent oxidoreductase [Thermomicrobiales bacterium]